MAQVKSQLSFKTRFKQKLKGTFDSPCMSVCNFGKESSICSTCQLKKYEKQQWRQAEAQVKAQIIENVRERIR